MTIDTNNFKDKLLAEKTLVEKELSTVARKNPENPGDFEPVPDTDERPAERDEVADKLESFEENIAITRQLEARLGEINSALDALQSGTYGKCSVCENDIEIERLEANPSATTCKAHMK
ncbi:MAG: TraR/DksA C4-type zinc finger protein [bacterium]|nr:TraR/DksA C4-type zinc finger protein [bacterium]